MQLDYRFEARLTDSVEIAPWLAPSASTTTSTDA